MSFSIVDLDGDILAAAGENFGGFTSIEVNGPKYNPTSFTVSSEVTFPLLSSTQYVLSGNGIYGGINVVYGPFGLATGD